MTLSSSPGESKVQTEQSLTIGSLFSGIGGLELGLERAGLGPVVWQVEKDPYCLAVLEKHWPDAERYEDVRDVHAKHAAASCDPDRRFGCDNCLRRVDIICGGFPCQDISSAGKRVGIRGERSGLWSEYLRIIRQLRPRYVVVENVARLLADGMGVVLGELAESGYDAEWDCIPAASVGAPHLRDRVFIVAYAVGDAVRDQSVAESGRRGTSLARHDGEARSVANAECEQGRERRRSDVQRGRSHETEQAGVGGISSLADAECGRLQGGVQQRGESSTGLAPTLGWHSGRDRLWRAWESEPDVGRVAHGVPARVVEPALRALGNAVVPQVAEVVGRVIQQLERERSA